METWRWNLSDLWADFYSSIWQKRPSRTLRSCAPALSISTGVWTKTTGEAAFSQYGPRPWNSLPEGFKVVEIVDAFWKKAKTALFSLAFDRSLQYLSLSF